MRKANVFVLGLDEPNRQALADLPDSDRYEFHGLLSVEELQVGDIPIADLLDKATAELEAFTGSIDAIVGFWDFPVSSMVPILAGRFHASRAASLEAMVRCEHKYWSRLEQQRVAPDEVPPFEIIDLSSDPKAPERVRYPCWLKPVKGFSSELAFEVDNDEDFAAAVQAIHEGVGRIGEPFQFVLDHIQLPPEIEEIGAQAAIAEEKCRGVQVATEGYAFGSRVTVYGVLDSINYPDSPAFLRHQYPSQKPAAVCQRLADVSERVIRHIGLDNSTFSVELFYDPDTDEVKILEINPRHSQSHAFMFEDVDGVPNHHAMLKIALGEDPHFELRRGEFAISAKWYHRRFEDAVVRRVPDDAEIADLQRQIPGLRVNVIPEAGQRLSDIPAQDSYSYELTDIWLGAQSEKELVANYERAVAGLHYEFEDVPSEEG